MWKPLNNGDNVTVGDALRYRSNTNSNPVRDELYLVVKADQHYCEIIPHPQDKPTAEPPSRKIIRYIDIGYNLLLEIWFGTEKEVILSAGY